MYKYKGFAFKFKSSDDLTYKEIEEKYLLCTTLYPAFRKYYERNRYYSSIKPQEQLIIRKGKKLVGGGKFQWAKVKINKTKINFFSFGLLIYPQYQSKGIGTYAIKLNIKRAKKKAADVLFGSSSNPAIDKICKKLGFQILKCKVSYITPEGKKKSYVKDRCYLYEFTTGIIDQINSLNELDIGTGPV